MSGDNFFLRITRLICFVICLFLPCSSNAQEPSANWWNDNMIVVVGRGFSPSDVDNIYSARSVARRAAVADGYRMLAEQIKGVRVTAETTVESLILSGDIIELNVAAVIRGAKILSEDYDEYGACTVTLGVPIYGAKNSVAIVAFKQVDKKDFPLPSEEKTTEGNYTGLIIDCGDMDLNPVLLPVIRNTDNLSIYSYDNLDYDKLVSGGMVDYAKDDKSPTNLISKTPALLSYTQLINRKLLLITASASRNNIARAGDNPLIIKATELTDDNSCPVISTSDADKILSENQVSHFLDEGAVVFTSYKIGGIRA